MVVDMAQTAPTTPRTAGLVAKYKSAPTNSDSTLFVEYCEFCAYPQVNDTFSLPRVGEPGSLESGHRLRFVDWKGKAR